jgi:hypothetical protein
VEVIHRGLLAHLVGAGLCGERGRGDEDWPGCLGYAGDVDVQGDRVVVSIEAEPDWRGDVGAKLVGKLFDQEFGDLDAVVQRGGRVSHLSEEPICAEVSVEFHERGSGVWEGAAYRLMNICKKVRRKGNLLTG